MTLIKLYWPYFWEKTDRQQQCEIREYDHRCLDVQSQKGHQT